MNERGVPPTPAPRLPTCEVIGPDGARVVVHPHDADDRTDDLRRALGAPGERLVIDGRVVDGDTRLAASGLRHGSSVGIAPDHGGGADPAVDHDADVSDSWEWAVVAGPACTPWRGLPVGRHRIGRARDATVRVDDPGVEAHHGILVVDADGVRVVQLTGRVPLRLEPVRDGGATGRCVSDEAGGGTTSATVTGAGSLRVGASVVLVRRCPAHGERSPEPTSELRPAPTDPWRRVVVRRASPTAASCEAPLDVPSPPGAHRGPPASGLIGAAVAASGAGLLAVVLGQAMFAAFAAVGAIGAVATWIVGAVAAARRRRRDRAGYGDALDDLRTALRRRHHATIERHRLGHPTVPAVLAAVDRGDVWQRRLIGDDPVVVTIGHGSWWSLPPLTGSLPPPELTSDVERASRLDDVAVPVAFERASATAVHGPRHAVEAALRSIVVQIAAGYGPADCGIVVVTDRLACWRWATWLPHTCTAGRSAVATPSDTAALREVPDDGRPTVLVVDAPAALDHRTGDVRRFAERVGAVVVVGLDDAAAVPAVCRRVIAIGATGRIAVSRVDPQVAIAADSPPSEPGDASGEGGLDAPFASGTGEAIAVGVGADEALAAARALAPLVDPELLDASASLPTRVGLADIIDPAAITADAVVARWQRAGNDPAPVAVIGAAADGVVAVDLARDGPHALVAGTTGSGKSELLRTFVVSLAVESSPALLNVVLVDFKGGSTFDRCRDLPHTVGVVTDLDDGLAGRALTSLDAEVRRRERLLRASGADDLSEHRRLAAEPLARLVVIVDEFASLAKEHPDVLAALVSVAQRGRSLGIHLVLATQRPAGVVTDDIRANTNLRLALRLHDRAEAIDVVSDAAPSTFPRSLPGRATLRLGPGELLTFQAASCTGPARSVHGALTVVAVDEVDVRTAEPLHDPGLAPTSAGRIDATRTELDAAVEAVVAAADRSGSAATHRPWLDPLPTTLAADQLSDWLPEAGPWCRSPSLARDRRGPARGDDSALPVVGVIDDPAGQTRHRLRWDPAAGNLLLVGSLGSGTTSTLVSLVRSTPVPWYVLDAGGDPAVAALVDHSTCGAVIRVDEAERLQRLLRRLAGELDARASGQMSNRGCLAVAVDGFAALRSAVMAIDGGQAAELLDRLLRDGPAQGITWCIAGATIPAMIPAAERWVFHVDDPAVASALGVRAPAGDVPGRCRVASTGLEAQVCSPDSVVSAAAAGDRPCPIDVLPPTITDLTRFVSTPERAAPGSTAAGAIELPIGVDADRLAVASLHVGAGDHVLVAGGPSAGVTGALETVVAAWRDARPGGRIVRFGPGVESTALREPFATPTLFVVDDADRVDDVDGVIAALLTRSDGLATVVAGARLDRVRAAYGHWTREVARSRCGLLLTGAGDVDGDLFDVALPRRTIVAPRPGLAWIVDRAGRRLVQVAARMPS